MSNINAFLAKFNKNLQPTLPIVMVRRFPIPYGDLLHDVKKTDKKGIAYNPISHTFLTARHGCFLRCHATHTAKVDFIRFQTVIGFLEKCLHYPSPCFSGTAKS
jgi:hypothetical protein